MTQCWIPPPVIASWVLGDAVDLFDLVAELIETAERLGWDNPSRSLVPDTDLDTHVLVAVPKCETCGGTGDEPNVEYIGGSPVPCPDCDGRGWRMPDA